MYSFFELWDQFYSRIIFKFYKANVRNFANFSVFYSRQSFIRDSLLLKSLRYFLLIWHIFIIIFKIFSLKGCASNQACPTQVIVDMYLREIGPLNLEKDVRIYYNLLK